MKGYKATKFDMTCRGFQFDIGQEYSVNNDLVICKTGFHFCQDFEAISDYYPFENNNRYFEIEAIGEVITRGNKSCTSKIRIIRELNDEELKIFGIFKTIENELTKICYNGSQSWYLNGKRHREDGPAIIYADGEQRWYLNGELHREDGPAVIGANGYQAWYLNGKRHREDGPAIIWANGYQAWYLNGQLHREDGPAVIWANGSQRWYLNSEELTEQEFNNRNRPCVGKVVVIDSEYHF